MKQKHLIYLLISLGLSYMAYTFTKNKILSNLKENNQIEIDTNGKIVLTPQSQTTAKLNLNQSAFDYNNAIHAPSSYWTSNSSGTFYLPIIKNGIVTNDYVELTVNNGNIEPTFKEVVKNIFSETFDKVKSVVLPFTK